MIEGLHSAGTLATVKHFPGHGNTATDSHTGFPCIYSDYETLKQLELIPFQAAIDGGADMVMTAHIQYPQIEKETYLSITTGEQVYLPATMSKTLLTDILRGDMGFEGVIVSDALDMAAIADNFTERDTLRLTISAGVDMLLLPAVTNTDQFRMLQRMMEMAVEMARSGEIGMDRIDDAVRRILTMKKKCGLLAQTDFAVTEEQAAAAAAGVGSAAHRELAWEIAKQALTLVKNENEAFPITLQPGDKTLILFADSCASRVATGTLAQQLLAEQGAVPEDAAFTVMTHTRENGEECVQLAEQAEHVILVNRVYNTACMDPNTEDGFSTEVFDQIIAARHAEGKPVIVISCQLPYDAARFPEADALLLAYTSSPMRSLPPASGAGSAYAPNPAAALCACFGTQEITGRLPVRLPALAADYAMTGESLFVFGGGQ